ncbi:MAG TPA: hypothetical protein VL418_08550 [Devosiaceae bacterium]|nr:hypothetical protein [Devosiaceae bacterium]
MTRVVPFLVVAMAVTPLTLPAIAADIGGQGYSGGYQNFFGNSDDLRSGFSQDFDNSDAYDPLTFELGLRYWYSWGAQKFTVGPSSVSENDNTNSAEAYFRVDDHSTGFYAKGIGGVDFAINGSAADQFGDSASITDGHVAYAGADLGYSWLGDPRSGMSFGPFAGYMYWNDSPNMGRANYTVGTQTSDFSYNGNVVGPGDSQENNIEINALRLGFSGKANLGTYFDVNGELAAVPYANLSGVLGAFGVPNQASGSDVLIQSSAVSTDGWGYGAMGELMFGYHPTSNLTFRLGGRAWYLQGQTQNSYNTIAVSNDSSHTVAGQQRYVYSSDPWSLFRYGLLTEMTYNF